MRSTARVWRNGFAHGFIDALRLAQRELNEHTWLVLDKLADLATDANASVDEAVQVTDCDLAGES